MMESVYHAELASGLEKAGHQIRYEGKSFELANISRDHIEGFSKRSQDINAELAEMGQTRATASRALKQTIALKTRLDKEPEISREELQRDWERQRSTNHDGRRHSASTSRPCLRLDKSQCAGAHVRSCAHQLQEL